MDFRPYFLYTLNTETAEGQNLEGDFIPSVSVWNLHSKCRDQLNGAGRTVALADGQNIVYAGIIYMDVASGIVPEKTEVIVTKTELSDPEILNNPDAVKELRAGGQIRLQGTVKSFEESRLNIRLWV